MDIRQLHYFLVLCEEMNYTRASQRLFLSRQALRQSITALEAELCGPLFVSAHHKLSLTERGLSLQRHAAPVVEQFQQMQAALHAEIQSAQPVRIGISVSLVPDYLPGLETQLDTAIFSCFQNAGEHCSPLLVFSIRTLLVSYRHRNYPPQSEGIFRFGQTGDKLPLTVIRFLILS